MSSLLEEKKQYDADSATLKRGDEAFQEENYQKALEIYRILSQLAENKTTRRKALYGLACTRLILATNQKELNESIILWDAWSQMVPSDSLNEDPRMLRPMLIDKNLRPKQKTQPVFNENGQHAQINTEIVQTKNKEIQNLEDQLKLREKEIEKLKHQINTLEAIDQDILTKKKKISTR